MHDTSRSVLAAARTHPAGFAASSAVIVTAIVLFTLVTSGLLPVISPGRSGAGPAPVIQPGTAQPRHRTVPQQAVPTGPPMVPGLTIDLGPSTPSLTGRARHAAPPATGSGSVSGGSQHLPPRMAGSCPACSAGQTPVTAATATGATGGNALRDATQVPGNASAASAVPLNVAVSVGNIGSAITKTSQTALSGVTAAASNALRDTTQVLSNGSGVASAATALTATASSAIQAVTAATSAATAAVPLDATVSVQVSADQALPVTVSLPGVG